LTTETDVPCELNNDRKLEQQMVDLQEVYHQAENRTDLE
jgi:hypothetical protein